MTNRLALIALYTIIVAIGLGVMLMTGFITPPAWAVWALFIASGNLVYTKVMHNREPETISLVMAFILIAIQTLGWPEIAIATIVGVGFGEIFLTKREWYKKLFNTLAITFAGVMTEIIYTYSNIAFFSTILGTAIIFDIILFTLLVPIWLFVAKQSLREVHASYFETYYTIPVSAGLAWIIVQVVDGFGAYGIIALAVLVLAFIKPLYVLPEWATTRAISRVFR